MGDVFCKLREVDHHHGFAVGISDRRSSPVEEFLVLALLHHNDYGIAYAEIDLYKQTSSADAYECGFYSKNAQDFLVSVMNKMNFFVLAEKSPLFFIGVISW